MAKVTALQGRLALHWPRYVEWSDGQAFEPEHLLAEGAEQYEAAALHQSGGDKCDTCGWMVQPQVVQTGPDQRFALSEWFGLMSVFCERPDRLLGAGVVKDVRVAAGSGGFVGTRLDLSGCLCINHKEKAYG